MHKSTDTFVTALIADLHCDALLLLDELRGDSAEGVIVQGNEAIAAPERLPLVGERLGLSAQIIELIIWMADRRAGVRERSTPSWANAAHRTGETRISEHARATERLLERARTVREGLTMPPALVANHARDGLAMLNRRLNEHYSPG